MKSKDYLKVECDRREFLLVVGALALTGSGFWPGTAVATPVEAKALIKKVAGGAKLERGKVKLKMPAVADNGARVSIAVTVDSPMTANDYVKAIHIISDGNPYPETVSFTLSPEAGKAEVSFYMRMAKTQKLYAVAEMSDGSFQMAFGQISVTIGGC